MSQPTEATIPFSEGDVEYCMRAAAATKKYRDLAAVISSPKTSALTRLHDLETEHLDCRILVLPHNAGSLRATGGRWVTVRPRLPPDGAMASKRCMAISQSNISAGCRIVSPVPCGLRNDDNTESVQVTNYSDTTLQIKSLNPSDNDDPRHQHFFLRQRDVFEMHPGVWELASGAPRTLQLQVFPRKWSLVLARPLQSKTCTKAGTKRRRERPPRHEETDRYKTPELDIVRPLVSLTDLSDGETALAKSCLHAFSLFRMRSISDTRAARLFEARHSAFPGRIVVVKALRLMPGEGAASRAVAWKREYQAHVQIKCEHIVELLGGEIALGALFLRRVDARDLGKSEWCNRGGDWRFRGTCADAKRVLQNMASALRYLHDSNLVHNDVKPANILYHRQKGAKLVDFGLATRLGSAASTGGTPWYLPPEFLSRKQRGAPADVFALGIVMAYLLGCIAIPDCGREAKMWLIAQVHGNSGSPAAKAMADWLRIVNEVRRNLQDDNDPTHQLVLQMLKQRPKDRITAWDLDAKISDVRI